ncbi:MAG: hypothetical protein AAFP26_13965, partial [Planctomycetota bacterium]
MIGHREEDGSLEKLETLRWTPDPEGFVCQNLRDCTNPFGGIQLGRNDQLNVCGLNGENQECRSYGRGDFNATGSEEDSKFSARREYYSYTEQRSAWLDREGDFVELTTTTNNLSYQAGNSLMNEKRFLKVLGGDAMPEGRGRDEDPLLKETEPEAFESPVRFVKLVEYRERVYLFFTEGKSNKEVAGSEDAGRMARVAQLCKSDLREGGERRFHTFLKVGISTALHGAEYHELVAVSDVVRIGEEDTVFLAYAVREQEWGSAGRSVVSELKMHAIAHHFASRSFQGHEENVLQRHEAYDGPYYRLKPVNAPGNVRPGRCDVPARFYRDNAAFMKWYSHHLTVYGNVRARAVYGWRGESVARRVVATDDNEVYVGTDDGVVLRLAPSADPR